MATQFIRNFKELNKSDAAIAGGKGASLGEMTQASIPVPPGFVVLSDAFEHFIKETDLIQEIDSILHKVNHKEIHTVERASEAIKELILNAKMPAEIAKAISADFKKLGARYVAVRSSATAEDGATAAWAGQLESYLNTTENDVLDKVKHCWASLFTPRAIFYRFEKGLHETKISVAVVVQKMIESEVSGIAFSVHPVTEDYNQLIIEAGFGLGEAIVSGQVTPDSYVVEKEPRNILDVNISTQERALYRGKNGGNEWTNIPEPKASSQVLTKDQILELSELILKIENHYGFPCDIEWAYEAEKFYIVQSRPITTLSKKDSTLQAKEGYPVVYGNEKLKWVKFMERKRTPFIYFPFVEIEAQIMPKICGFRFFHHLYKWSGNTGVHFRVADEFVKCDEHFLKLIKAHDPRIKEWAKKGHEAEKRADEWLKTFSKKPIPFSLEKFNDFYKDFTDILLYTATMAYLVLSTIDTELTKGATRKEFEEVLSIYEPLRNTSKYPELERIVLNAWFNELGKKYALDPLFVHFMTPDEIRNLEVKGINSEELKKRKDWSLFWNDIESNVIMWDFDHSYSKEIPVLEEYVEATNTLKGNTAFPGKAKGVVRIVNMLEDVKEFNQGDILVSLNTNPDLVPVIKKAGAIVTDEGGIMCHAAIVSREFKIPCVIGTKIATKVLKDGDMVEVDADNGVVRILDKRNPLLVDGIEWYMTVTRNMSFWHQDLANEGLFSFTKEYGIDAKLEVLAIVTEGTRTNAFMHHANYNHYANTVMKKVSTASGVSDLKKKYKQFAKEVFESLDQCKKNFTVKNWEKFMESYKRLSAGLMITATIGRSGGELLSKKLKDLGYDESTIPDMIATITYPKDHTPLFDSQLELLEIGKKVQAGASEKEKKKLLGKWLDAFGSIPVNFCDDPWTEVDALAQLNSVLTKDCSKEFILAEQNHKKRTEQSKVLLKKIDNSEVSALAYAVAEGTYLNEFRKNVFCKTSLSYRPLFQKIADLGGSKNWRDCFFVRSTEMTALLEGKKISIPGLVKQRQAVGVYRTEKAVNKMLDQETVNGFVGYIHSMHRSNGVTTEGAVNLKGHSANKGKVTGIAKIILGSKDFHKLNSGEILVTTMTSVDFVPVMERAAAFVTNEGGITSHASIVAREMNKPCIIGTKNATQVIKDGDMVEVDADNGVVRILDTEPKDKKFDINRFKNKNEYLSLGRWVSPTLEYEIWMDWSKTPEARALGVPVDDPSAVSIDGHYFVSKDGTHPYLKERIGKEFKSGNFDITLKILDLARSISGECVKLAEQLSRKNKVTFDDFMRAFDIMSRLRFPWMSCFPLGDAGEEFVHEYVKKRKLTLEKVMEMIPQLPNSVTDDQRALSRFKSKIQKAKLPFDISAIERKNPTLAKEIKQYQKETEYIGTHHLWGDARDLARLVEAIKNSSEESNSIVEVKKSERAFQIIAEATKWRLECAQSSALLAYTLRPFMTDLAKAHYLSYAELIFLVTSEIKELIAGKEKNFQPIIQERQKALGILKAGEILYVTEGENLRTWEKHFGLLEEHESVKEFKGAIGNKGIVRGIVAIVVKPSDQSKVQSGMILVAPETTPDFIPAMGKAAAFVTDQGGITSHAAIVAREMRKPCITGTKIATKVLKDGDMVEVDADNGVVRILK